jgi:glycosyltransferase involved in cell wall biosynthesis
MKKFIVVHSGRRDDYQVALALAEAGMLHCLVTDFYSPFDSQWFRLIIKLLPQKIVTLFKKRYKAGLTSNKVINSYKSIFYYILSRIAGRLHYKIKRDRALGLLAKKISINESIPIVSTNLNAMYAFENNFNSPKVLFQFHPHPTFVQNILKNEMYKNKKYEKSLRQEYEFSIDEDYLKHMEQEPFLSDSIICASSITKQSLLYANVCETKIEVIPYGVDTSKFIYKQREINDTTLKIIFIGSLNQRKGVTYLLEALDNLANIELIIVGRGIFDTDLLKGHHFPIRIYQNVKFTMLLSLLYESHCFVLPSLIEGFGQVILEAMATGIPVVASENTIAKDIIENEKNGFVVPICNFQAIKEIIVKLQNNRQVINQIGLEGYLTSKSYTWEQFRRSVRACIEQLS